MAPALGHDGRRSRSRARQVTRKQTARALGSGTRGGRGHKRQRKEQRSRTRSRPVKALNMLASSLPDRFEGRSGFGNSLHICLITA
ncbi:hypothetical protein SKAU_G00025070 [Synaphobranchus kaupii]|uniref:Uncharacterized protein n=1 Tax=Synaphobranchus kaupii TaxID=118154 RepID=A0A9Q1GDY0_SYNKA|nr:hypothetical protein SKAU_G00025070 [Synaphobranchus kaupii]